MLKILHIAPLNFAGVPYNFHEMHLKCGDISRLVTLHKNTNLFPEDICLNLPLPDFSLAKKWRRSKLQLREQETTAGNTEAPFFEPRNLSEKIYFSINDLMKKNIIERTIEKYALDDFDIIHYDSGLDFFRNSSQALKWKKMGKKIVCCYYGSDLRTRGIIREMDRISDLNITSEFDHLALKKNLHYIFYPYDPSELPPRRKNEEGLVRIVHSPTNRKFKGTELIIGVIERIRKERAIEFLLVENTPRDKVLEIKSGSDICIDQVGGTMGGTGYGKAGIESLAMGVVTITNMSPDYQDWLPQNPFVVANDGDQLYRRLMELIDNPSLREEIGNKGIEWVSKYHGIKNVNERLYQLYREHNIL